MKKVLCASVLFVGSLLPFHGAFAAIPAVYTNDNFWTSEHDKPVFFEQDPLGNFFGSTATGKVFSQVNIENELGIRLQKFSIDEAYHYITDRGVIVAESDIEALSIYLTKSA